MADQLQILYKFTKPARLYKVEGNPADIMAVSDIAGNMDYGMVAAGSQMWGSELISLQEQSKNGVIDTAFYRIYHNRFTFPVYVSAGAGIEPVESVESLRKKLFYQIALVLGVGIAIYGFILTRKRQ